MHGGLIAFNSTATPISVRAGSTHFCTPKDDTGPYSHVDVVGEHPLLSDRYRDPYAPFAYCYVPIGLVERICILEGGIKFGRLPPSASPRAG